MEATTTLSLPPATLRALTQHLHWTGSKLSLEQAVVLAIGKWQASHIGQAPDDASPGIHGYQWKTLFLPEGSDLRMSYIGETYYARVLGDHLIYQGRKVSPREWTMSIAGNVRNAWHCVFIRFPGSRDWTRAIACRLEHERDDRLRPASPADAMAAAAACMSDALNAALSLVEQVNARPAVQCERRQRRTRRAADSLADECSFD